MKENAKQLKEDELKKYRKLMFEQVPSDMFTVYRAAVPGGWLVGSSDEVIHDTQSGFNSGWDWRTSLTFITDPKHTWEIGEK
jgi:hypothetical protein